MATFPFFSSNVLFSRSKSPRDEEDISPSRLNRILVNVLPTEMMDNSRDKPERKGTNVSWDQSSGLWYLITRTNHQVSDKWLKISEIENSLSNFSIYSLLRFTNLSTHVNEVQKLKVLKLRFLFPNVMQFNEKVLYLPAAVSQILISDVDHSLSFNLETFNFKLISSYFVNFINCRLQCRALTSQILFTAEEIVEIFLLKIGWRG